MHKSLKIEVVTKYVTKIESRFIITIRQGFNKYFKYPLGSMLKAYTIIKAKIDTRFSERAQNIRQIKSILLFFVDMKYAAKTPNTKAYVWCSNAEDESMKE